MKNDKGCYNTDCINYQKKIKFPDSDEYCPKCGQPLHYVCINHKCYKQVEGLNMLCRSCEMEKDAKKDKRNKAIGGAFAGLATVAVVFKDQSTAILKEAVKFGIKIIKK
mgnify:CR=1 FL=1